MGIIYLALNRKNGKGYVGQTRTTLKKRKYSHELESRTRCKLVFHKALKKHGIDKFDWYIIEKNIPLQYLDSFEIRYINYFNTFKNGYNSTIGGSTLSSGENHPCFGVKRPKQSEFMKKHNPMKKSEVIAKFKGDNSPSKRPEVRKKLSEARMGNKMSVESRKKSSLSHRKKWSSKWPGAYYAEKKQNPWTRVWVSSIRCLGGTQKQLGCFNDPYSASLVYFLVLEEITKVFNMDVER